MNNLAFGALHVMGCAGTMERFAGGEVATRALSLTRG